MKTKTKRLVGILIISVIQLTFPLYFIAAKENIIETGKEYAFRIEPVDPYNFFQGRYVELNIPVMQVKVPNWNEFKRYDMVYVEFKQTSLGAEISGISKKKSRNAIKLKLYDKPNEFMHIRLPFKKFFMEENKAKNVELQLTRISKVGSFVHVRVKNGDFVLIDISSNGKSLVTGRPASLPS